MSAAQRWEIVVGLETHAQLSTTSKIFSGASTAFGAPPNAQASAVDIALPGVLPVLNRGAVERAVRFGIAVGATINARSVFARKNYFYPDLPKGYQISQYEIPVVQGGRVVIASPTRGEIMVRITRAHLEEDAGKSLHEDFHGMSGIDLNRAGTPLLEIVSEPDLRSSAEAVAYAKALHSLVRWIGICDGNMQEGSFRCDANVSVRPLGEAALGTRCEIKNLNSFRFLQQAIDYEARRQIELVEDGGRVMQETRLYDPDRNETRPMRSKEDAQDYRYFPDPDLPPLVVSDAWIREIEASMPESQQAIAARLVAAGVSAADAAILTDDRDIARYFDRVAGALGGQHKLVAHWIVNEVLGALHRAGLDFARVPVPADELARILRAMIDGKLARKDALEVFAQAWQARLDAAAGAGVREEPIGDDRDEMRFDVDAAIEARAASRITDDAAIESLVDRVLAEHSRIVAEFEAGKDKAFNALVGKAMQAARGKADPAQVNAVLRRKLKAPEDA